MKTLHLHISDIDETHNRTKKIKLISKIFTFCMRMTVRSIGRPQYSVGAPQHSALRHTDTLFFRTHKNSHVYAYKNVLEALQYFFLLGNSLLWESTTMNIIIWLLRFNMAFCSLEPNCCFIVARAKARLYLRCVGRTSMEGETGAQSVCTSQPESDRASQVKSTFTECGCCD